MGESREQIVVRALADAQRKGPVSLASMARAVLAALDGAGGRQDEERDIDVIERRKQMKQAAITLLWDKRAMLPEHSEEIVDDVLDAAFGAAPCGGAAGGRRDGE